MWPGWGRRVGPGDWPTRLPWEPYFEGLWDLKELDELLWAAFIQRKLRVHLVCARCWGYGGEQAPWWRPNLG